MRKVVDAYDDLKEEMNEWEEASLQDLQDWYEEEENIPEPNEALKQAAQKYKEQVGVPIMVDPKTGKFFYEEPETSDLDKDRDGVIEEEELTDYINKIDLNKDGLIDIKEAQKAGLDLETVNKINQLKLSISSTLPSDPGTVGTRTYIESLKQELIEQLNKKNNLPRPSADPDNTITY